MAMLWRNKIPISAVIYEFLVVVALCMITFFLWKKYVERKKKPVLYLGFTFTFFSVALLVDTLGRWLGFLLINIDYMDRSFTDICTLLSYIFLAIANCFVIAFMDSVFFHKGTDFILPFSLFNGVVIGLIIPKITEWIADPSFGKLRESTYILYYYGIISILSYGLLAYFGIREGVLNDDRLPKVGFYLIGTFGVCMILMFVTIAGDTILVSNVAAFSQGYSPLYYIGFTLAAISLGLGYLGYIMPDWFKNIVVRTTT
ncbi:MAG: hypothetical protein H7645_07530 [Candidatus Heimdallarchaeota archaeon]|nr:hypothetical protein [Candidatus Heimdallarchaeota archaeon]MCK4770174.1 hypothetical protein [Candidatus Heimdallarchaeota archaeon]